MKNEVLILKQQVFRKIYTEYLPIIKRAKDLHILLMYSVLTELFDKDEINPLEALARIFELTLMVRFQESQSDELESIDELDKVHEA